MTAAARRLLLAVPLAWLAGAVAVATAGPAAADTPEGWPEEPPIDMLEMLLVLGGIPLLVFVVTWALVYAPSVARGESISAGHHEPENQWLGGPRKSAGELAAPDSEGSRAGGAGGTW